MKSDEKPKKEKIKDRLKSGKLADQKCWSFIKELNSRSEERLDSIAMHDGYRKYTYRQMFRAWERYAEAFTAVHLTGKDHARVGLIGAQQTETIFAFYALNMTGASVSLIYHLDLYDEKRIRNMIKMEKITDLVISEVFAFPKTMEHLLRDRKKLGLRNIILLESPMGGEFPIPMLEAVRKMNTLMFREFSGGLLMEDLLREYEATPISYGENESTDCSIILHTTGTVSVDMCHTSLGLGMEVVTLPLGVTNPHYAEAIEKYGISILFTSRSMLDTWNKSMPDIDLSSVKVVFMGGSYVSPEFKKTFNDYLQSAGSTARIVNGYGLSELGGACSVCPSDRMDDSIGFLLPGYKAKIWSEEEEKYYNISDGPRTGVLCISAPTMSSGKLDDTVIFELEKIDGEDYFNSNDLMRVNEDGSLTCIGRSNKLFVNNAGIRFDVGLVENAVAAQPGIAACGIAPEFHKILHDNVPVLYVETSSGADGLSTLRKALMQVFITDGKLADTNLPSQCVLTDHIPLNSGGKVDSRRLASGSVEGERYNVKHISLNGKINDIVLLPVPKEESGGLSGGIPEELEDDPYNLLAEIFAAIPEIQKEGLAKVFRIPGVRELMLKLTDFDISNIPGSIYKLAPKLMKLSADQPLSRLNGDFRISDIIDMLQTGLSMFRVTEAPLRRVMESPMFPMPMPFLPPVPPMLPMFPMPFWGWNRNEDGDSRTRREQDETTSSDADESTEDNMVETADDPADNTDK